MDINPKCINLTSFPCNAVRRTKMVAENKSKVRAELSFDMEDYPQFKVSQKSSYHDDGLDSNCTINMEPGSVQEFNLFFIPRDLAWYEFMLPVIINGSADRDSVIEQNVTKIFPTKSNRNRVSIKDKR